MDSKLDIKLLYLALHNFFKKKYGLNREITRKQIVICLGQHFFMPKGLRYAALKELEEMGLIKRVNREKCMISEIDIDLEESSSEILKKIYLF